MMRATSCNKSFGKDLVENQCDLNNKDLELVTVAHVCKKIWNVLSERVLEWMDEPYRKYFVMEVLRFTIPLIGESSDIHRPDTWIFGTRKDCERIWWVIAPMIGSVVYSGKKKPKAKGKAKESKDVGNNPDGDGIGQKRKSEGDADDGTDKVPRTEASADVATSKPKAKPKAKSKAVVVAEEELENHQVGSVTAVSV